MKYIISFVVALILGVSAFAAQADATYPYSNPTYLPTAVSPAATYTAPADYAFQSNGLSVATVRVTGTCTSLAAVVQGTNDSGANWTTLNITSIPAGANAQSISAAGFWRVNASGFNQLRVHITALTASCTIAMAGTQNGVISADPCNDPSVMKSSVALNQGASATAKVVDAVTGKAIYVCGFVASAAGTNPTVTFISGTKTSTDCDTGPANLSGAIVPSATTGAVAYSLNGTVMTAAASKQLCMTTGATTSIQGVLNYVQQ